MTREPSEVVGDRSMTRKEADRLKASLELDLIAYFKQLEDEVMTRIDRGVRENMTPDQIIQDVGGIFDE